MEALLISACLLGVDCKYNGGNNRLPEDIIEGLRARYELVSVCPELEGGLSAPRRPCERLDGRVINTAGEDLTVPFASGAERAAALALEKGCALALLKENSPSCGSGTIYDGSFSHTVISGDGVTAERLRAMGLRLYGESRVEELL